MSRAAAGRLGGTVEGMAMDYEVLGAALAVVGALLWIRRDLRHDIAGIRRDVRALNGRIDAVLLARAERPAP